MIYHNARAESQSGWSLSTPQLNAGFYQRYPVIFKDDLVLTKVTNNIVLTDKQRYQAKVWGFSKQEERRYNLLMENKTGSFYGNRPLTPIDILGINARTDQERAYYADRAAKVTFMQTAKLLAYVTAYHDAAKKLKSNKHLPMLMQFNASRYSPYQYQPLSLKPKDQLMLFIHLDDSIKAFLPELNSAISRQPESSLNIYFIGRHIDDQAIKQWAKHHSIKSEWVVRKRITLNKGDAKLNSLTLATKHTPLLLLLREGVSQMIGIGRL